MDCIGCELLGYERMTDAGTMAVCNGTILEDGKGRPMMSVCCEHEWCPKKSEGE